MTLKQFFPRMEAAVAQRMPPFRLQHLHSLAFYAPSPTPNIDDSHSQKSSIFNVSANDWTPVEIQAPEVMLTPSCGQQSIPSPLSAQGWEDRVLGGQGLIGKS